MINRLTETDVYASRDDYERYSVSKLKTYKECSMMYKLKYIDRLDSFKQSTSTVTGTLLHAALEYLYGIDDDEVQDAKDAFFKILAPEFSKLGIYSAESILGELLDYHDDINHLYNRASAGYMGADAIRTGKGAVPKVPEMTGIWKKEVKRLDLDGRKARIDYTLQSSKNGMEEVSITEAFSKALKMATAYATPNEFEEILHLELPLTEWDKDTNTLVNAVPFPGCEKEDVFLNGYIDNISKVRYKGRLGTAVIDYKSSKEEFNEGIVSHNQQLLMYAAGVEKLLGIEVDFIGILSFVTGKLTLVEIDREIQKEVIDMFNKLIVKIDNHDFIKHVPDTKYAPCMNSFGSTCPFLKHCWPASHEFLTRDKLSDDFLAQYM